jgi:hypothetical protein
MWGWPPLALAVWVGVASTCLAAEPRLAGQQPATPPAAAAIKHNLSLDVGPQALSLDGSAFGAETAPAAPGADLLAPPESERRMHLDIHLGRTSPAGRSPGDAPPLYGEVGIDLDPLAGLSLVPSYRLVLDEGERTDARTTEAQGLKLDAQVLKLGARIRF